MIGGARLEGRTSRLTSRTRPRSRARTVSTPAADRYSFSPPFSRPVYHLHAVGIGEGAVRQVDQELDGAGASPRVERTAKPLVTTHPLATCTMGTRFFGRLMTAKARLAVGAEGEVDARRWRPPGGERSTTLRVRSSITVTSFTQGSPAPTPRSAGDS